MSGSDRRNDRNNKLQVGPNKNNLIISKRIARGDALLVQHPAETAAPMRPNHKSVGGLTWRRWQQSAKEHLCRASVAEWAEFQPWKLKRTRLSGLFHRLQRVLVGPRAGRNGEASVGQPVLQRHMSMLGVFKGYSSDAVLLEVLLPRKAQEELTEL